VRSSHRPAVVVGAAAAVLALAVAAAATAGVERDVTAFIRTLAGQA